jgi:hypothetical protein
MPVASWDQQILTHRVTPFKAACAEANESNFADRVAADLGIYYL